ncbi:MAG: zinc ribbon domain-containing protein [Candidatus Eisenbacteria bacterium]|nr:zinc ribbon domain-containing protein [Candidatus Eisenbacteria bacterium]
MKGKKGSLVSLIVLVAIVLLVPVLSARATAASGETILCPFCGAETPVEGKFCGTCGKKLPLPLLAPPAEATAESLAARPSAPEPQPIAPSSPFDSTTAKALFETGLRMMTERQYDLAAVCFGQVVETYPGTAYAQHSAELRAACESLVRGEAPPPPPKEGTGAGPSFLGGMLGGLVGILGLVLFIALIASGA